MRLNRIGQPFLSRSSKNTVLASDEDPKEDGHPDPVLRELAHSGTGPVVDALVVASCLHRMAANRASLYATRAKGKVQNAGVASVRERGVHFGFDD